MTNVGRAAKRPTHFLLAHVHIRMSITSDRPRSLQFPYEVCFVPNSQKMTVKMTKNTRRESVGR
jgi:hypothetical protein